MSDGESIHSRKPIATIADLKGQTIRVNNEIEAKTLRKLGAIPVLLPLNKTMDALGQGKIDGATVAPAMVFEFGFGRLTSHHYLLHLGAVPTALVMNRKKLESLPEPAQALIRKYSGEWLSSRAAACFAAENREMAAKLKADRRRTVVEPSPADLATAQKVFSSVVDAWAAESPRHRELLTLVRAELKQDPFVEGNTPMTRFASIIACRVSKSYVLTKIATWAGVLAMTLLPPFVASAAPIELKLAFFPPEHTAIYDAAIKPFVDAINTEGKGLLAIKVYPNGALGKAVAEQPQMVLDGVADIGWVIPGQTSYRFPDNQLLEMPGLFRDVREGTLTYTRLIAAKALRGYQDFVVIGAFTADPTFIHSRKPIGSLAALKGQKLRANNHIEAEVLGRLGAVPTVMPASRLADAIGRGAIDGAALAPTAVFDFRVAAVAKNHYLLGGGVAPLVVLMSRKKFDSLPEASTRNHPQTQRRVDSRGMDRVLRRQ